MLPRVVSCMMLYTDIVCASVTSHSGCVYWLKCGVLGKPRRAPLHLKGSLTSTISSAVLLHHPGAQVKTLDVVQILLTMALET